MTDPVQPFSALVQAGVMEVGDGYRAKNEELGGEGPIFLRAAYLQDSGFSLDRTDRFQATNVTIFGRKVARLGDVVITTKGNSTGRVGRIAREQVGAVYSPHLSYWRSNQPSVLDQAFLYYWSRSDKFRRQLAGMAASTDMAPYLSLRDQMRLRITLPPIEYQKRAGETLSALDDKIALNTRMNATLDALARTMFDNQELVENWIERPLAEFADLFDGPHATPKRVSDGPVFLGISNLDAGLLDLSVTDHVSEEDFRVWTRRVTPGAGDIVFSYETRLGQAALVPTGLRCCLGRRMGLLRARRDVAPVVLLRGYLAPAFQETLRRRAIHGSTVDRIPLNKMGSFPIRLPIGESASRLASQLLPLRALVDANQQQSQTLTALRDLLLPRLISGQLRLRDAERAVEAAL